MCDSRKRECFSKGTRKRGKGESFRERSKKEQSARKISRCARNDDMGEWVYFTWRTTDMFGKRYSSQCHPERSRGIFLAHRYSVLCETAEKGNPSAKGARKSRVQGRFLATLEMTVWGDGFISCSVQRICLESAIPVSSSRAKSRDLSCTPI